MTEYKLSNVTDGFTIDWIEYFLCVLRRLHARTSVVLSSVSHFASAVSASMQVLSAEFESNRGSSYMSQLPLETMLV